jgi:uncharacterized delta-60 repeat protein
MTRLFPTQRQTNRKPRRTFRPQAEGLEARRLLNAGELDTTFGVYGPGFTLAAPGIAAAVQLQSDGKILAAGGTLTGSISDRNDFRLVRLSSSGALDPAFGTGGSVTTDFFGQNDRVWDMAILPDNRIVVVGTVGTLTDNDFGLACYLAADTNINDVLYHAGDLDPRFGTGGKVTTNISTYSTNKADGAYGVIVQDDGKIVVGGETQTGSGTFDVAMARYFTVDTTINSGPYAGTYKAGSLDPTFGQGGIVQNHLENYDRNGIWDMAILRGDPNNFTDDIIVTMEDPYVSGRWSVMETRYRLDGSFDTSFGVGGRSTIETLAGSELVAWGMAVQPDGSAVMTGYVGGGSGSFLLRYTNTGQLDSTFGTGGIALFGAATGDFGYSVAIQPSGKIVVAGQSDSSGSFVAGFQTNGAIDTTFGANGDGFARDIFAGMGSSFASSNSLILQPDGKIVAVGNATTRIDKWTNRYNFLIARYEGTPRPWIEVSPTSGLTTTEGGGTANFSVVLTTQPTADVTIPVSSNNTAEGTVSTSSLTFTTANWNVPQTVTVTGVDDPSVDGDIGYTLVIGTASSSDPAYNGLDPSDVSATNTDNEVPPTKFYVANDGSPDKTYEYGSTGVAVENYSLNSGNTAPRGAASTAAGNKVWVVDANKTVYVYNTSGGLLGSWSAGSLAANATVEGIATNGTDVWIVDARQDKVFRYTGAASRLSGSQNAASSFDLNSSNKDPKDVVTDGSSLWVVNDSSTDKVFKYNLSGTLLGSWTVSGAGSGPTGITLDPSNVSNLWIVDSGTKRVYQFDNAASRTSGSQSPSTSFALAAGNTNPQGIADPPTGSPLPDSMPRHGKKVVTSSPSRTSVSLHDSRLSVRTREPGHGPTSGQADFGLMPVPLEPVTTALPTARPAVRMSKRLRPALGFPSGVGLA